MDRVTYLILALWYNVATKNWGIIGPGNRSMPISYLRKAVTRLLYIANLYCTVGNKAVKTGVNSYICNELQKASC